jgi:hypothetical protein
VTHHSNKPPKLVAPRVASTPEFLRFAQRVAPQEHLTETIRRRMKEGFEQARREGRQWAFSDREWIILVLAGLVRVPFSPTPMQTYLQARRDYDRRCQSEN